MLSFRDASIRRKLMLITMMTSGVALTVAAASFLSSDVISVRRDMLEDLHSLARVIGANCQASLTFNVQTDATNVLSALKARPSIVSAGVYDRQGALFADYARGDRPTNAPPPRVA